MAASVPLVDLAPWFDGSGRAAVAAEVDAALRKSGFLLVTGHGVPSTAAAEVRRAAREFFALPEREKAQYAVSVGGRGWLPPGAETNAYAEGTVTPPDLKETFAAGADRPVGDPDVDAVWFPPNAWPARVPALERAVVDYMARMKRLADDLLTVCAVALGLPPEHFTAHTANSTFTFNVNRYPPLTVVGEPAPDQYRIGPHTDFGTVTILDREPGAGGLQVHTAEDGWVDAPYDPAALTVNIGDLMARWTGDRWKSNRHRVLPPQPEAPDEDLVSLVFFYECDHDTTVASLPPPIGEVSYPPVTASAYLSEKLAAISTG
ncbi:isopenicillin N synthase family dioxygenase [Actinokineospora iranica]|uniref:Isopenicillin N synthase n=1 Tax=Actinokineospora iranica TaxID=1271860 RepID=A0A1G6K2X3_9PSEU|nr:2-oxoglutarate and iron-dependent oxygenase domain-containing protein [Actinokineospora iranica]SDC24636.1 Isopenicillin N synthase [Actinokineospora iranica]